MAFYIGHAFAIMNIICLQSQHDVSKILRAYNLALTVALCFSYNKDNALSIKLYTTEDLFGVNETNNLEFSIDRCCC